MNYVRFIIYFLSFLGSLYGLTCFNYDGILKKGKMREFYTFYFLASMGLAYVVGSFVCTIIMIRF